MVQKKYFQILSHTLFCIAVILVFGNFCRLRPAAYPSMYKEYISGAIVLAAFYANLLLCFPLLFTKNRPLAYCLSSLFLTLLAASSEFALVYPQIHNLLSMQFETREVREYLSNSFFFIFSRDCGFAALAFMLGYIKHLSQLNLSKDMLLMKHHKQIDIAINNNALKTINAEDICLCKQNGNYSVIYMKDGTHYDNYGALARLYELMDKERVIQVSRNCLVALDAIIEYNERLIKVNIGNNVPPEQIVFPRDRAEELYVKILSFKNEQAIQQAQASANTQAESSPRKLSGYEKSIYQYIRKHPSCTSADLQKLTGLSPNSVYRYISVLKQRGLITHTGSKRTGGYYAVEKEG